ncbi:DUF4136 domain-containing protein [Ramlibacter sp. WS9]|uniref:DUF4136 domain-containing protein n=1 Tax=Ramlibacter sp. WS9 TaxID=1882741 RepID=UPI001E41C73D|nr:DUF4136 domain-containing protein [Ramlibacter sp. WS9]
MKRLAYRLLFLPFAAALLVLSGCATSYILDNSVQSFSNLPALPAQPTYRFERLPSQQAPDQAQLEAMADAALHKAGLRRDDATPRYSVQVGARLQAVLSPWADPWDGWGGFGFRRRGFGFGIGSRLGTMESPWYHREVSVIVRDLSSNRVVYETRASNDGPWSSSASVFPAMFEAAMQGFPTPPAGPRSVHIQVVPPANS